MYVAQRPSGLAAGPTTANPTRGMIVIAGHAFSPWLLIGAGIALYATRKMWHKLK